MGVFWSNDDLLWEKRGGVLVGVALVMEAF